MHMKSALLVSVAAGAIVLSTAVAILPASATPVITAKVSSSMLSARGSSTPVSRPVPNGEGSLICSGDLCIQRVTSIVNNKATIEAWAWQYTFTGHFQLSGPDGTIANSQPDMTWVGGGDGYYFRGVAKGSGYSITEWQGTPKTGYHSIGKIPFGV